MYGSNFVAGGIFKDMESGEMIDVDYLRECFTEMAELLQFIQNVENGMITISIKDYTEFPPVVMVAWGIYKRERSKKQNREIEQMRLAHGAR